MLELCFNCSELICYNYVLFSLVESWETSVIAAVRLSGLGRSPDMCEV